MALFTLKFSSEDMCLPNGCYFTCSVLVDAAQDDIALTIIDVYL